MTVVDLEQIVRGEYDENVERLNFQGTEVYAIWQAMAPAEAAAARERSFSNLKRGDDVPERENFPVGKEARARGAISLKLN